MNEKIYIWDSDDYAKHFSAQHTWSQELIDNVHLQVTESVLDIGCGDGKVTFAMPIDYLHLLLH